MTSPITSAQALGASIGNAIAKRRKLCGMTQDEVAERLQIGVEAMSRLERGVVIPSIQRIFELAEVFGCSAAELVTEASPRGIDQGIRLSRMLETLSTEDQELVTGLLEKLATRLKA